MNKQEQDNGTIKNAPAIAGQVQSCVVWQPSDIVKNIENKSQTPTAIQSALIVAMMDLVKHAEDTVWITPHETVFERLVNLYAIAGGKEEKLATIWPQLFDSHTTVELTGNKQE